MRKKDEQFIKTVLDYYHQYGRDYLPWRQTQRPYRIAVSEIMLQQTQVDRVIPKYRAFLQQFPTTKQLAEAPLSAVLSAWQGLGYNRRAKLLHQCAQTVTNERHGRWPKTYEGLQALPGIGPYAAGAIMAFAYNEAVPLIETNVRTVYLHHWFVHDTDVTDQQILQVITDHLSQLAAFSAEPSVWYAALMDYGPHLKKNYGNPNSRAKSYTKQSTFKGSDREVRGAIVRVLSTSALSTPALHKQLAHLDTLKIDTQLKKLSAEGLIIKNKNQYRLPG